MSLLIFAAFVLIVLVLALWLIDTAPFGDDRIRWVFRALAIVAAILALASRWPGVEG